MHGKNVSVQVPQRMPKKRRSDFDDSCSDKSEDVPVQQSSYDGK